eukprot:2292306-Amphidinium_carterae.1
MSALTVEGSLSSTALCLGKQLGMVNKCILICFPTSPSAEGLVTQCSNALRFRIGVVILQPCRVGVWLESGTL